MVAESVKFVSIFCQIVINKSREDQNEKADLIENENENREN
jgi:hypothetical protein